MLVASEVKGELARIVPARHCCRRAELAAHAEFLNKLDNPLWLKA